LVDEVLEVFGRAGIPRLADPEDRFLAELTVGIGFPDLKQFVERRVFTAL
jgi:hypothetical protein